MPARLSGRHAFAYILAQVIGACVGAISANVMFGEAVVSFSRHARHGGRQVFSEV
jgi:glycerol uptake facilitator-like aquaporin